MGTKLEIIAFARPTLFHISHRGRSRAAEVSFIPQIGGESCALTVFISRGSCREGGLAVEPG